MMGGIVDWGVYVARHRLPVAMLAGSQWAGGAERSLAWADEDSITMAVEAARRCLNGRPRENIGLLVLATTTHGFAEKQGAAIVASALGLRAETRTVDIGASLRCGAEALLIADDALRAERVEQALVVVADCRMGAPGSELERSGGDAAVAFLLGGKDVVALISAHAEMSEEIVDSWRRAGDRFTHMWEDRFVAQHGVAQPSIAVAGKLPTAGTDTVRNWVTSAPNKRAAAIFAKTLGVRQMEDGLFDTAGFCGSAHAPLLLAAALDKAETGQEIAMVAHGDGAAALLFTVAAARPADSVARTISDCIAVPSLAAYRRARQLDATEYPVADDQGIAATIHYRERAEDIRLQGQRCACGEPQFPKGRVCIRCGRKDDFVDEDFAEHSVSLITYTLDSFFPSPNPPTCVGVVKVDDGPRMYLQLAELPPEGAAIGMRLRFAFRCIHKAGNRPNYFWKALPEGERP